MKKLAVILLGPPGSGKGSQAKMIQQTYTMPHISTGDLLRSEIQSHTPLGTQANEFISQGQLVPDQLITDILFQRLQQDDCKNGYILDGYPRTLQQAKDLNIFLNQEKISSLVIYCKINDPTVIERISGRLTCKQCGKIYHKHYFPPKKVGICDACGGKLYQRNDDTKQVIMERLSVYKAQTAPLIAFYEQLGLLHTVDASSSAQEILKEILKMIG